MLSTHNGIARLTPGLLLCTMLTCTHEGSERPGAWVRVDLWMERPEIETAPFPESRARPLEHAVLPLGAKEVRDLSRVPPESLAWIPKQSAALIRALGQVTGSRLRWSLELGEAPYLSFVPLSHELTPCACRMRVGIRDAEGGIQELYETTPQAPDPLGPATVYVDLGEYAGQRVDLLLQVDPPLDQDLGREHAWIYWGSPGVYSRKILPDPGSEAGPPNVILVGLDTVRADALGAYGRSPSITPGLDRLAEESDLWLQAFSVFNVTNPSFASILTGLYGKNHRVYDLRTPLPQEHTTLAEVFAEAGYETLAIIAVRHLGPHNSALDQGFQEVTLAQGTFSAELAVDMAMDWMAGRQSPFFLWLHLFDPHTPHTPPKPYSLGFRPYRPTGLKPVLAWTPFRSPGPVPYLEPVLAAHKDLYDGEMAYLDRQVDRLMDFLRSRGLLRQTVVAVVADHGENLGEHGFYSRHVGLYETTLHVPLMIRWPGERRPGRRFPGLVETLDLFPTLLAAAGLPVPPQDGIDLRQLTGGGRPGRRAVFAEHSDQMGATVRTREYRYTVSRDNPAIPDGVYLFDLRSDPEETTNLSGQGLAAESELAQLLNRWLTHRRSEAPRPHPIDLPPEELERLRALGYL